MFESDSRIGGHTATVDLVHGGEQLAVDTGFIVYNDRTYPGFIALLDELGVKSRPTQMSFSVRCDITGLEYAGSNLATLFADWRNLLRPAHWQMLFEILRFNKEATKDLENNSLASDTTLGDYLAQRKYSQRFIDKYLLPMGAAIWSSGDTEMHEFPLLFFVRFFKNHGLLAVKNRPQWRTICGGSSAYLQPLVQQFEDSIYTRVEIDRITRSEKEVKIAWRVGGEGQATDFKEQEFDALVVATHSDQALQLLGSPTAFETEILSSIAYQKNDVVLHTDDSLLPQRRRAWSSWNYRIKNRERSGDAGVSQLTYNMNILQGLQSEATFCVSLNQTNDIALEKILGTFCYSHPVYTVEGIRAQGRWRELAGKNRSWFCGAYWGSGFHEDGVVSALRVVDSINQLADAPVKFDQFRTESARDA